jgi:hypothetical protein
MARIGGSVYSDVHADAFYQTQAGPSPMMQASLIFNLVNFRLDPAVHLTHTRIGPRACMRACMPACMHAHGLSDRVVIAKSPAYLSFAFFLSLGVLVFIAASPKTPEDDFWTEADAAAGGKPPKSKLFQEVYTTKNRMVRIYKVCGVSRPSRSPVFFVVKCCFCRQKYTEVIREDYRERESCLPLP